MKHFKLGTFILCLFLCTSATAADLAEVTLLFSPHGGCESAICKSIDAATDTVFVAAYSFSSKPIARALYAASNRGVDVRVILDRRQTTVHYSMANDLMLNGLNVRVDRHEPLMHLKTIILDRILLICGSYNFTASAEHRNAEIIAFIKSEEVATKATTNWLLHWNHATPHEIHARPSNTKRKTTVAPVRQIRTRPLSPSTNTRPRLQKRTKPWSN